MKIFSNRNQTINEMEQKLQKWAIDLSEKQNVRLFPEFKSKKKTKNRIAL